MVVLREGRSSGWGYFTHCAALCVLLALAVCHAPLLHDYTVVYRGSLDGAILACVVGAILHLFLWVSRKPIDLSELFRRNKRKLQMRLRE